MISPSHPLQIALGLVIWSGYFVALYTGLSLGCQMESASVNSLTPTWLNHVLWGLTLVVACGLLLQGYRCWRWLSHHPQESDANRFIAKVALAVYGLSAFATLVTGAPTLVLGPCL